MSPEKAEEHTKASNLQNRLLESILVMQNDFIKRGIYYGWCKDTIENLLFLSESDFGFICELLKKENGTPYIKSHGITNIAWNEQTRQFYEENKEKGLEFFNFDSLWGQAITTGEPVIANDPDNDDRRGGYPKDDGHPKLQSFLGLPVKGPDGEVVGVMGVANRPNGYDHEIVEFLSPFLNSYGMLIEKYRSDQQRKTLEIEPEKLISDLKNNQKELKKSKDFLDSTNRMARVGGWELDADTLEVVWTDETYRIHEVPLDSKTPLKDAIKFYYPEDRPKLERAVKRALDHGEPYDIELRLITAKGKKLWTRSICHPETVNGKTVRLKGTFQDISKQMHAKRLLIESEQRYRSLFELHFPRKSGHRVKPQDQECCNHAELNIPMLSDVFFGCKRFQCSKRGC
jgi:PAS domain-containing protein